MENKFINHTGGAAGSDLFWEEEGIKYNVYSISYSFPGHKQFGKNQKILSSDELLEGYKECEKASKTLKRPLSKIQFNPYVRNLISRNWFQVKNSTSIFAIGTFENNNHYLVNGGTGWAVQMAINNNKTIYFFDQLVNSWFKYNNKHNVFDIIDSTPLLTENFAGIGTRELKENGKEAIINVYKNTFK